MEEGESGVMCPLIGFHMKLGEFKTTITTEVNLAVYCSLAYPRRIVYGSGLAILCFSGVAKANIRGIV